MKAADATDESRGQQGRRGGRAGPVSKHKPELTNTPVQAPADSRNESTSRSAWKGEKEGRKSRAGRTEKDWGRGGPVR